MKAILFALVFTCSALGAAAVVPPALKPVTVVMLDGEIIQGYFVGRDATTFTIQASDGKAMDIAISKIKKAFDASNGEAMSFGAVTSPVQRQPIAETSPTMQTPDLNTLPVSSANVVHESPEAVGSPWFPQQPARLVISLRGAYGFPTVQETSEQQWGYTYSEYETGISASWEAMWFGGGIGLNYEWHQDRYHSVYYDYWSGSTFSSDGTYNWGVASLPVFVEVLAPFKYIKPGVQVGAEFYATSGYTSATGLAFQVTPILKFIPTDHFEVFLDCKFSRPFKEWPGEGNDFSDAGRWTIGTGIGFRL